MTEPVQRRQLRSMELQRLLDENSSPASDSAGSRDDPEPAAAVEAGAVAKIPEPPASDTVTRPIAVSSGSRPAQPEEVARLAFERQTIATAPAPAASPSRAGRLLLAGGVAAAVVAVVVVTATRFSGSDPAQPAPGPVVSVLDTARTAAAAATSDTPAGSPAAVAPPATPGPMTSPTPAPVPAVAGSSPTSAPARTAAPAPAVPSAPAVPPVTAVPSSAPTVDPAQQPDGPSVLRPGDEKPGTVVTGTSRLTGWVPLTTASGSAAGR